MLKQSNTDISSTSIVEYPLEDRFLKLPIENFLKLLDFTPLRPQYLMINSINCPDYRFGVYCFSRRTGKTAAANIICFLKLLEPNTNVLLISSNYTLSSISWNEQKKLIKKFNVEVRKMNEKDRVIELANGSTILLASINKVDSTVGRSYDLILFDEVALAGEPALAAFQQALRPTLDKDNSKAIFISTPRGLDNPFHSWFLQGYSDEYPLWFSAQSDYLENPRLSDADIAEAKKSMPSNVFQQEYCADFTVSNEGVVYDFDFGNDVIHSKELERVLAMRDRCDKIIGIDIGFKDATTAVVLYVIDGVFYVVEEYTQAIKDTKTQAENISEICDRHDVDFSFGDSAAAQVLYDWAYLYDLTVSKAKKDKLPGISYVATAVENHELKIAEGCEELLKCMRNYSWKPETPSGKEDTLHAYSDLMDALRYGMYSYAPNLA